MGQEIINKEGSLKFVKESKKDWYWRLYLLENHPLYNSSNETRGGLIENPDDISWDSWIESDVIVVNSKLLNGSSIDGYFEIRDSTIANLQITDTQPNARNKTLNLIRNSTLNFHAPIEIYLAKDVYIVGTCIDGYVNLRKVEGLMLKNSCLTGSIDLSNCYELLELEDCFFNGNLIFTGDDYSWVNVKLEGNQIIK